MFESYGVLVLAGTCILLIIWIHGHQVRRPSQPISGGRDSVAPVQPLYAHRTGSELDYAELEEMSRTAGLRTYRIENIDLPCDSLPFGKLQQMEMMLQMPGDNLVLVLHVEFSEPCSGEALYDFLNRAELQLASDGLYSKTQEYPSGSIPIYYVANHSKTGSFNRAGQLIENLHQIAFFMQLPLPVNGLHAFNGMLRIAEEICDKFGGSLQDEGYESLTRERVEGMVRKVDVFASKDSNLDPILTH